MRKFAAVAGVISLGIVGSAQADKAPPKPKPAPKAPAAPRTCTPRNEGFKASGTLISISPTTIEVMVKKANHHAPTGDQTYPLGTAKVKYHHGVSSTAPAPGSRVKLSGKITQLPNPHCSTTGFTPTVTLKKVDIAPAPKH